MCTFLMKMREYYRWEQNIPLAEPLQKNAMGQWLVDRETQWETITENSSEECYSSIHINNTETDPFDSELINKQLHSHGLIYSSGYGLFNKPHFFIGELEKTETYDDYNLFVSAREYARDLTAPPAMLQGSNIFIRKESIRRFVWEKIEEWQWKKNNNAPIARMIEQMHCVADIKTILDNAVNNETNTMILHEIGEIEAGKLLGKNWEDMLLILARTKSEILLRAARDILADCLYTIPKLIENEQWASLHFYFANYSGIRKALFPQAYAAYTAWVDNNNTSLLSEICQSGIEIWHNKAQEILLSYQQERNQLETIVESCLKTD